MSCICAASTLRLFVRSIVQVDLPASTIHASRQSRRPLISVSSSARTLRQLHSTPARLDSTQSPPNEDIPSEKSGSGTSDPSRSGRSEEVRSEKPEATKNAVAEISLESIDEILAESGADDSYYTVSPPHSSSPRAKGPTTKRCYTIKGSTTKSSTTNDSTTTSTTPKTIFRKTKVASTGLAIHYSSPPAPLKAKSRPHKSSKAIEAEGETKEPGSASRDGWTPPPREHWQIDKQALKEKYPDGWKPRRRLSPDALAGIRAVHAQMPTEFTTQALAERFEISPEAIRRILKSKWSPNAEEETDRERRWFNRGKEIYTKHAATGQKAPKKWREAGVGLTNIEWLAVRQRRASRPGPPALVTTATKPIRTKFGQKGGDSLSSRV